MQFIKSCILYCKSRENPDQYYKSRKNLYQVLHVTRARSERPMKSKVRVINTIVASYTGKYHEFVAVCIVMTTQHE